MCQGTFLEVGSHLNFGGAARVFRYLSSNNKFQHQIFKAFPVLNKTGRRKEKGVSTFVRSGFVWWFFWVISIYLYVEI